MMTQGEMEDGDTAVTWVMRLRDPGFDDWEAFTVWLEADPRHNDRYEQAALADRELGDVLGATTDVAPSANDNMVPAAPPMRHRKIAGWSAAAAVMLAAVTGYPLLRQDDSAYQIETAPGEQRRITLPDGTRVDLNGATRLTLHRGNTRLASLDSGQATFTVVHDDANPFTLEAGSDRIRDVGTVFDVTRGDGAVEIGVSEGEVVYNPAAAAVHLTAGQTLHASSGTMAIGRAEPGSIGTWRSGRLVYRDVPVGRVAGDVSRYLGVPISATPEVAARAFNGVIVLDHDPQRMMGRLAPLLGVAAQPSERGWRLTPLSRETR